uniref:Uncharacterized protein n=1 Tax=Panagrolaimus sp. ES5 TaxID=591445 RepID=A0AC34GCB1_9BILA
MISGRATPPPETGLPGFIGENTLYRSPSQQTLFLLHQQQTIAQNQIIQGQISQQHSQQHSQQQQSTSFQVPQQQQFHINPVLRMPTPPPSYNSTVGTRLNIFNGGRVYTNGAYYASPNGMVHFVNNPNNKQVCSPQLRI